MDHILNIKDMEDARRYPKEQDKENGAEDKTSENFSKLWKMSSPNARRSTTFTRNNLKSTPRLIIIKLLKNKQIEKNLKSNQRMKKPVTFKGAEIRLSANLSETVEARKQYNGIFKVCMKKKVVINL